MRRIASIAISAIFLMNAGLQLASAATAPPPPTTDPPDWISAPSLSNTGNFNVSWDASTSAGATYDLEMDSDPAFSIPVQVWSGMATQYACTGITNGCWFFRVKASAPSLAASYCKADHQTWVDTSIPTPPADPTFVPVITNPAQSSSPFIVSWTRPGGICKFRLQQQHTVESPYYPPPPGFVLTTTSTVYDGANASFSVTPVDSGDHAYKFRVRVYTMFFGYPMYGAWSSWSSLTEIVNAPPDKPWRVEATGSTSGGTVLITVGLAHDATSYEFKEDVDAGFPNPVSVWPAASAVPAGTGRTNFDLSGKTDGTYFYMVRAVNAYGASEWVRGVKGASITGVPAASVPAAPASMTVPAYATVSQYKVSWTGVAFASSYQLQEDVAADFSNPVDVSVIPGYQESWVSKTGTGTYYYRVRAVNSLGSSSWTYAPNPCTFSQLSSSSFCHYSSNWATPQFRDILPDATGKVAVSLKIRTDTSVDDVRVESLTVKVSGSGDDAADLTHLSLYCDTNGDGEWTPGSDLLLQGSVTFDADNGTAVFSGLSRVVPVGGFEKMFVVADFSGSASAQEDFSFEVPVNGLLTFSNSTGLPMWANGIATGVTFTVYANDTPGALYATTGANPPSSREASPGAIGVVIAALRLTADEREGVEIHSITIEGAGTGDEAGCISSVRLYEDVDADGAFTEGTDRPLGTPALFNADDGIASVALPGETIPASGSLEILVVYDFSPLAVSGTTYTAAVDAGRISASGLVTLQPMPVDGLPVYGCTLTIAESEPPIQGVVYAAEGLNPPSDREVAPGTREVVMAAITLTAGGGEGARINSISIEGSGTGDEYTGIASVRLYEDVDADGAFTDGTDRLLGTPALFTEDDGIASIAMPGETIPALGSLRILVVYDVSVFALGGRTYVATVDAGRISATGLNSLQPIPVEGLPVAGCTLTIEAAQPPIPPSSGGNCGAAGGSASLPGAAAPLALLSLALFLARRRTAAR